MDKEVGNVYISLGEARVVGVRGRVGSGRICEIIKWYKEFRRFVCRLIILFIRYLYEGLA